MNSGMLGQMFTYLVRIDGYKEVSYYHRRAEINFLGMCVILDLCTNHEISELRKLRNC